VSFVRRAVHTAVFIQQMKDNSDTELMLSQPRVLSNTAGSPCEYICYILVLENQESPEC